MNSTPLADTQALDSSPRHAHGAKGGSPARPTGTVRKVHGLLRRLQHGTLDVHGPDGSHGSRGSHQFAGRLAPEQRASIHLHDEAVYARVLQSGDIGLAEAYVEGQWSSPDLRALLELFMRNRESLERAVYGSRLGTLAYRLTHWLRRNTRRGSRRNVRAHYDLGNDFYAAWLDPTMNYSSAWFGQDAASLTLPEAQQRKVERALDEAGFAVGADADAGEGAGAGAGAGAGTGAVAGRRLLEIGCGWGAVAEAAAARGAHVVGVTLSQEQLTYAQQRLQDKGLHTLADLRLQDYRDLAAEVTRTGRPYDGIVSIEMFEAVGRAWWTSYFETLRTCLAPEGRACVQVIVIRDDLFERYVRGTDFIQQYVFPGGLLPSTEVFRAEAAKGGLEVVNQLDFGADYARTLSLWRLAFHAQRQRIEALGYDERFLRLWDFYLAYCEAAFTTGQTDVVQFTLRRRAAPAAGR